jgi:hypothetical protein
MVIERFKYIQENHTVGPQFFFLFSFFIQGLTM